jgi:hypothetical protein
MTSTRTGARCPAARFTRCQVIGAALVGVVGAAWAWSGGAGRSALSRCAVSRFRHVMVDGRNPMAKVRPLVLWGPTGAGLGRQEHCGSRPRIIKSGAWRTGRSPQAAGGERVVA